MTDSAVEIWKTIIGSGLSAGAIVLVARFGLSRVAREIRLRHAADTRRELFISALKDSAEFISQARTTLHRLGTLAALWRNGTLRERDVMEGKVVEALESYARAGALIPPELVKRREAFSSAFSEVGTAFHRTGDKFANDYEIDKAIGAALKSLDLFVDAFENWKADRWAEFERSNA